MSRVIRHFNKSIEGFKSIHSIKDLPLHPINLLIGANGSGKSNFLEAFVFLKEIISGDSSIETNRQSIHGV